MLSGPDFSTAQLTVRDLEDGVFRPDDVVEYTLSVPNTGNAVGRAVQVRATLPETLELLSAPGAALIGDELTWRDLSLEPGERQVLTFQARIATPLANGRQIAVQARIDGVGIAEPFLSDDPATPEDDDATVLTVTSRLRCSLWLRMLKFPPVRSLRRADK